MESVKCADPGCRKVFSASLDKCDRCSLPKERSVQYYTNKRGGSGRGGGYGGRGSNRDGGRFSDRPSRGRTSGGSRGQKSESKGRDQGVDMNNSTVAPFVEFAKFLDARHDQHERIVKLSRDITIESKRAIFLLHRIQGEDNEAEVLGEAKSKLDDIRYRLWYYVAKELKYGDPYLFLRAYTAGLQEYIEALSFYHYIKEGNLITWSQVQENLSFQVSAPLEGAKIDHVTSEDQPDEKEEEISDPKPEEKGESKIVDTAAKCDDAEGENAEKCDQDKNETADKCDQDKNAEKSEVAVKESLLVLVPRLDFLLGIADLTGEMMRKAITSAAAGNTANCFAIFASLQDLHSAFLMLSREGQREMSRKINVLEASLKKVEAVCYNINVRSTEIPKHLIGTYIALHEATSYSQDTRRPTNENEENLE